MQCFKILASNEISVRFLTIAANCHGSVLRTQRVTKQIQHLLTFILALHKTHLSVKWVNDLGVNCLCSDDAIHSGKPCFSLPNALKLCLELLIVHTMGPTWDNAYLVLEKRHRKVANFLYRNLGLQARGVGMYQRARATCVVIRLSLPQIEVRDRTHWRSIYCQYRILRNVALL